VKVPAAAAHNSIIDINSVSLGIDPNLSVSRPINLYDVTKEAVDSGGIFTGTLEAQAGIAETDKGQLRILTRCD
jgi:hypothetical protein